MTEWSSKCEDIVDTHVHMGGLDEESSLLAVSEATGIAHMGLVAIQDPYSGNGLPQALAMKARYPDRFYVLAGLNHATRLSEGRGGGPSLAQQAALFSALGCDGLKMIEGKPTSRQHMNVPVTDPYFADFWAAVEDLGFPIVWHVNDPEEFWDPDRIPGWAKDRNWGYGPGDVQKEELYSEVDEILDRHPRLRIIFAHFYFLSADLPRAARLFEQHPSVHFDLAPGVEMLYNISRDPAAGHAFFTRFADRIVFGTDLFSGLARPQAVARAGIVFRWLESEDEFRVPETADYLLGPPEDGVIRGMALPEEALSLIYQRNARRILGNQPRPLRREQAAAECRRLAVVAETLSGTPAADTEAAHAAEIIAGANA